MPPAERLLHPARWCTEEGFYGCPCRAVGQRPESQGPVVAKLLPNGCSKVHGLKALSLAFGSLEAGPTVVGGVKPIASALDRPDREAIRGENRAGLSRSADRACSRSRRTTNRSKVLRRERFRFAWRGKRALILSQRFSSSSLAGTRRTWTWALACGQKRQCEIGAAGRRRVAERDAPDSARGNSLYQTWIDADGKQKAPSLQPSRDSDLA
jgi:hypothetical protein